MMNLVISKRIWRSMVALSGAGMLFASSCSASDVRAIVNTVGFVADEIIDLNDDGQNDLNFGEWLLQEIN